MPKVEFTPQFSVGNVITIVALVCSLAGGYATIRAITSVNSARLDVLERQLDMAVKDARTASERADRNQLELVRTLSAMQADVRYLRQTVESLTGQGAD